MPDPFLAEIKVLPFGFAPRGWAQCNGQLLPINQNQALFALLGTTYGGNGQTNFALPDLRARTPVHEGAGLLLGQRGGEETHTLTAAETPVHTHTVAAVSAAGNTGGPANAAPARSTFEVYSDPANLVSMKSGSISSTGGNQPHNNLQPSLALNFCIALQGVFPSPT